MTGSWPGLVPLHLLFAASHGTCGRPATPHAMGRPEACALWDELDAPKAWKEEDDEAEEAQEESAAVVERWLRGAAGAREGVRAALERLLNL